MAWITSAKVGVLLQTDLSSDTWIDDLIDHAQALAEAEVGTQTEPVSNALQAVLAQIVARMWQGGQSAQVNPAALTMEQTGPFAMQNPNAGAAGLGLTDREIKALRRAAGKLAVGILPTTRGDMETPWVIDRYGVTDPTVETLSGLADTWDGGI